MKRIEKTAPPAFVDGVEDLFKNWGPSEPLLKKQGVPKGVDPDKQERCVRDVKGKVNNPYAVCNASLTGQTKKAELNGPKDKEMGSETFHGDTRQESGDLLSIVSRNAREKLQEKMGHKKEVAVYQKSDLDKAIEKMMQVGKVMSKEEGTVSPQNKDNVLEALRHMSKTDMPNHGQSYKQMGLTDQHAGQDMTVEDAKNLHQSPNWSAHKVMPLIHQDRRDEALRHFNHRPTQKSESIDWEKSEAKPQRLFSDDDFSLE